MPRRFRRWIVTAVALMTMGLLTAGPAAAAAPHWRLQQTPNPAGATDSRLTALSCPTASWCLAIGTTDAPKRSLLLIERWDGNRWSILGSPPLVGEFSINDIACPAVGDCFLAGARLQSSGALTPIVVRWRNRTWTSISTGKALPAGTGLTKIACASSNVCLAYGQWVRTSKAGKQLASPAVIRWNGKSWSSAPLAPYPHMLPLSFLSDLSCSAAGTCMAVGNTAGPETAGSKPLAEVWRNGGWHLVTTPTPAHAAFAALTSVSCPTATACTAVGNSFGPAPAFDPLGLYAQQWNGTRFTALPPPHPPVQSTGGAPPLSCWAPGQCMLTDTDNTPPNHVSPISQRLQSSHWTSFPVPIRPVATVGAFVNDVSCVSGGLCRLAGSTDTSTQTDPNLPPFPGGLTMIAVFR
jgi:hypothetical protein